MNRFYQSLAAFVCGGLLIWAAACKTIGDMDKTAKSVNTFVNDQNHRSAQTHAMLMQYGHYGIDVLLAAGWCTKKKAWTLFRSVEADELNETKRR